MLSVKRLGGWVRKFRQRTNGCTLVLAVLTLLSGLPLEASPHLSVVYKFTGGADGGLASGPLVTDSAGNVYGETTLGGALDSGVVFKLDTIGNETVLYSFAGGADGDRPFGGLARDAAGNLYGSTLFGGAFNGGVVFKLDASNNESVLHSFGGSGDGVETSNGPLVLDGDGNLYGTVQNGGTSGCACGIVFKLDAAGNETILHNFTGGLDGASPFGGLVRDSAGNLYGTANSGGGAGGCFGGCGTVFKLDTLNTLTVLHAFTGLAEGGSPAGSLLLDSGGNLYGATQSGGGFVCHSTFAGCGVIFKIDTLGTETVLYTFTGGLDGSSPNGNLLRDVFGNLYGTAVFSGNVSKYCTGGCGTLFKLSGGTLGSIPLTGLTGDSPTGGLVQDNAGVFYGVTALGGLANPFCSEFGCGTIFKVSR
jgi:uncharacterized repeat protein (TIGR03803 family)